MTTGTESAPPEGRPAAAASRTDSAAQVDETDIEWSEAPYIIGSGMCMGTADVVPGVSGGTMAVALGIYGKLLAAITSVNVDAVRALLRFDLKQVFKLLHWRFMLCLGGGVFLAFAIMIKIVKLPHLLETHPKQVYAVFFGLVLSSALILAKRLPNWDAGRVASLVLGVGIGWGVVNLVPVETPEHPAFIFLCGFVAISAMLLPGISGSFILLILGKYAFIFGNLTKVGVVVPFALGCGAGLAVFSRFLKWLLTRWHDPVVAGLVGLLIGSLWRIWPYQHTKTVIVREKPRVLEAVPYWPDSLELGVLGLFILGLLAVLAVEWLATRRTLRAGSGVS